jgi:WD40 repeat protein
MVKRYLWLFLIITLGVACDYDMPPSFRLTPRPTPALTPVYSTLALASKNGYRMIELVALSGEAFGPVAALAFTPDSRELLAVHGKEGVLRRWRLRDSVLLNTMDVGPVGMAAVAFDEQARFLAIGAGKTEPAKRAGYDADLNTERLWDTQSGELIFETLDLGAHTIYDTDVALSFDGQLMVVVTSGGQDVYTIKGTRLAASVIGGLLKEDYSRSSITAVTFDPTGTWVARADDVGFTVMEEWSHDSEGRWILQDQSGEAATLALDIDPSRTRLAAVTTESLTVWDLEKPQQRNVIFKESLSPGPLAGLVFSPDGALLAVGTASGWQVWSVEDKYLLIEGERAAFAVAFSPDGRLFAWGDVMGTVHVWGMPEH